MGLAVALAATLVGCDFGSSGDPAADGPRVVSLSPALTKMIVDLGKADALVGVGENDAAAPDGAAVVGTYLDPNLEKMLELQPTLIVTMSDKDGVPKRLAEFASQHGIQLVAYPVPKTVTAVASILHNPGELIIAPATDTASDADATETDSSPAAEPQKPAAPARQQTLGFLLDAQAKAGELYFDMLGSLAAVREVTGEHTFAMEGANLQRRSELVAAIDAIPDEKERLARRAALPPLPPRYPPVLLVIGTQPLRVVGPSQVHDNLLNYIGASNAASVMRDGAPTIDKETLLKLSPSVIIILEPNGKPLGSIGDDPRLASFRGLSGLDEKTGQPLVPAVANKRIVLIDDPMALLPSTSLGDVATRMAKAVHPDVADKIDAAIKKAQQAGEGGRAMSLEEVEQFLRDTERRATDTTDPGNSRTPTPTPDTPDDND